MIFKKIINEDYIIEFNEKGEMDTPVLTFIDNNDYEEHRFYQEDYRKLMIELFSINPKDEEIEINESYSVYYNEAFIIQDKDYHNDFRFYDKDIGVIKTFLSKLMSFGVIKI